VSALPSSVLEPLWAQVAALLPTRPDTHPLGCHRRRIPDRLVFDKLIQVLVFGCGYRRIADATCSATTLRRRRDEWTTAGVADQLRLLVLAAYQRLFGLELEQLLVDGCTAKAPAAARSPGPSLVDRCKQGLKRSVVVEAGGIPLASLPARPVVHLDAGYDYQPCRRIMAKRGMAGEVATRGVPAPVQVGRCWVVERTHVWGNQYGKLRWCTERRRRVVEFWLALAAAAAICGRLVRRAWTPLPLGRPSPPPQMTTYWRRL
jgi:transposase